MNRPYIDILVEAMKEGHKETINLYQDIAERFDKIIVWIIGLSTGSIALLLSQKDKLTTVNSKVFEYTTVIFVCTIIFGLVGRVLYSAASYMSVNLFSNYYSRLTMLTFPHEPRNLKGDETSDMIYWLMIEDFRIDMPSILDYKKYPKEQWLVLHAAAREFYLDYEKWSEKRLEHDFEKITDAMEESLGYEKGFIMKLVTTQKSNGKLMRRMSRVGYAFYIISISFFILGIIYFTYKYTV